MSDFPPNPEKVSDPAAELSFFGTPTPSREQVAGFLLANSGKIIRRVRGKLLHAESMGVRLRGFDTQDILSTVLRRIDVEVASGSIRTQFEYEFWAYVFAVAENAVLEKTRKHGEASLDTSHIETPERLPTLDGHDETYFTEDSCETYKRIMAAAPTESDRTLLSLKGRGASYATLAALTGRSQAALRKQFSKLRGIIRRLSVSPPAPPPAPCSAEVLTMDRPACMSP